jgi:hypothetical protein
MATVNQNLRVRFGFLLDSSVVRFRVISPQPLISLSALAVNRAFRTIADPGIDNCHSRGSKKVVWLQEVRLIPQEGARE